MASPVDILTLVVLAGTLGVVGQSVRVIAGLKKLGDSTTLPAGQVAASQVAASARAAVPPPAAGAPAAPPAAGAPGAAPPAAAPAAAGPAAAAPPPPPAQTPSAPAPGQFQASTLIVSLLIGFVAGVVAMLATNGTDVATNVSPQYMVGLMAAGYAGTDFIEAFMKKYLPGS